MGLIKKHNRVVFCAITTLAALLSNASHAGCPAPYFGGSIGINTVTSANVAVNLPPVISIPGYFRGVPFSAFAGYGGQINQNFYLGAEIFWKIFTGEMTNKELKTTYGYGISLMPGVMLCDNTLAFFRLGVIRDHFSDADLTRTGPQIGFGLQANVTQNIDIRGEYVYTTYSSFNNALGRVSSPTTDSFILGAIYKFD